MYRTLFSICAFALLIAACGKSNEPVKPPPPAPPKETVFDDLIANKDRAKQQTERAAEQNREKHEAAMQEVDGPAKTQ